METTHSDEILKALEARRTELIKRVDELRSVESELKRVTAAIAALTIPTDKNIVATTGMAINTKNGYDADSMTWAGKVQFALRRLGSGGVKTITDFILELEPDKDEDHIYQSVAQTVNKLANNGELQFEREGRGYIYRLGN